MTAVRWKGVKRNQPPFTQALSPPLAPRGTGSEATDGLNDPRRDPEEDYIYPRALRVNARKVDISGNRFRKRKLARVVRK